MKYTCDFCGWTYDEKDGIPEDGIAKGTKYEDLPENFACISCGANKDNFTKNED